MSTQYKCPYPGCKRTYEIRTQDGYCKVHSDVLLVPVAGPEVEAIERSMPPQEEVMVERDTAQPVEGLGVLVCDASHSMDNLAFPEERRDLTKLQLVVGAVQIAILAMHNLTDNDRAYIAIIAFGKRADLINDRQGRPFIRSVKSLLEEFGGLTAKKKATAERENWENFEDHEKEIRIREVSSLDDFLIEQLHSDSIGLDRTQTNVNEALRLAFKIATSAISGSLREWGIEQRVALRLPAVRKPGQEASIEVPNVRVMIYSDGEHNVSPREITNPFTDLKPTSVLMSSFIGDEAANDDARKGADQMLAIANTCPTHGHKGYFLVNTLARRSMLREVFHMASGASGFCRQCAKGGAVVQLP
jgi:hypothetical protein